MIRRKSNKTGVLFAILLIVSGVLSAQVVSPFNKLEVKDTSDSYSFLVSGHFYGSSSNLSGFPAATLLANIDSLNGLKPSFLMSLGDLYQDVNDDYISNYQASLFNKLKMPLLNAVGDHDRSNGNVYEKVYGKTFYSFQIKTELFIVLNTELNDGSIKDEQLEFLRNSFMKAGKDDVKNIFIFSHRPVWAERIQKYAALFHGNTRTMVGTNNFAEEVLPLVQELAKTKNVIWFSGSTGGGPASFFYDKNEELNVTFICTSIRDVQRDAILKVNVSKAKFDFHGFALGKERIQPISNYNISYWQQTVAPEQKFNFRLLPYLTLQMISHRYFWFGFVASAVLIFLIGLLRKRWKRSR